MTFFRIIIFSLLLISFSCLKAQNTIINSELGVLVGPVFMQTDYGEAGNFKSSSSNVGIDFGVAYVADFSDSRFNSNAFSWLADHMKTRVELSFSKVNLEHDGVNVEEGSEASINQFKQMKGDVKLFNIGIFGEWYFMSITRSSSKIQPYFLTGLSYSSAKASISFGDAGVPEIYNGVGNFASDDKNAGISFSYGLGLRYKLDDIDLVAEGRFQPFLFDEVEGLTPTVGGNQNNDSQVLFKVGAIFHLN